MYFDVFFKENTHLQLAQVPGKESKRGREKEEEAGRRGERARKEGTEEGRKKRWPGLCKKISPESLK